MTKDYYHILGISRNVGVDDIKSAYRKLAHKYHPDVSTDPDGEDKFKEIGEAYKILKMPERRLAYDRLAFHSAGRPTSDGSPPGYYAGWIGLQWIEYWFWWAH